VAREQPARLLDPAQARRHPPQQPVAGHVPERVVDELEVVEVDEQQRHGALAPARAGDRGAQPHVELRAVREAGQRVVEGEPAELGLGLLQALPELTERGVAHTFERALGRGRGGALGRHPCGRRPSAPAGILPVAP
jgi:hypothetical protein